MQHVVTISENALRSMTLATLEAYVLGDGKKKKIPFVETLGYLWGFKRECSNISYIQIDTTSISLSANRKKDSVTPNVDAIELKNALMERWSPHLTLMGDFHSHPYKSLDKVKSISGFEFSKGDESAFLSDDYIWKTSFGSPIMLVMTVCKLKRVVESYNAKPVRRNIVQFDVGDYRFWINVAVGYTDDSIERCWSGNSAENVDLWLNNQFYNYSSDRLI